MSLLGGVRDSLRDVLKVTIIRRVMTFRAFYRNRPIICIMFTISYPPTFSALRTLAHITGCSEHQRTIS